MYKLLYLVRAEADFERVVALAIAGKDKFKQTFIFTGDSSPFFVNGIQNQFQKYLFKKHGFKIKDLCDYDIIGIILKKISYKENFSINEVVKSNEKLFKFLLPLAFLYLLKQYLKFRNRKVIKKVIKKVNPNALLTDTSQTMSDYTPEVFRKTALKMGIPSCIFTHGAAGGLHQAFSEPEYNTNYKNYYVFVCSDLDIKIDCASRIILGDMSSSFPYVNYLHSINKHTLSFLNDRKFKIAFFQSGISGYFTSTSAWSKMEEIIINLSDNPDVAMIVKKHPRGTIIADLRMISTFNNVKIVGSECDTSRIVKWGNIVIYSDHCSAIFEPMILGKKVVAVEGKHIPKYKDKHSPLKYSSVKYISSPEEFSLDSIPSANPEDSLINRICWGNHGKVDLAKLFLEKVEKIKEV